MEQSVDYPIENGGPALHGDALEHGQHGEADVVEGGDAEIGALPLLEAQRRVVVADVAAGDRLRGVVRVARRRHLALRQYLVCGESAIGR